MLFSSFISGYLRGRGGFLRWTAAAEMCLKPRLKTKNGDLTSKNLFEKKKCWTFCTTVVLLKDFTVLKKETFQGPKEWNQKKIFLYSHRDLRDITKRLRNNNEKAVRWLL